MRREINLSTGEVTEHDDVPVPEIKPIELKRQELAALLAVYKEAQESCRQAYVTAILLDEEAEAAKIVSIRDELSAAKKAYNLGIAEVKAKYS